MYRDSLVVIGEPIPCEKQHESETPTAWSISPLTLCQHVPTEIPAASGNPHRITDWPTSRSLYRHPHRANYMPNIKTAGYTLVSTSGNDPVRPNAILQTLFNCPCRNLKSWLLVMGQCRFDIVTIIGGSFNLSLR
jgi:hypothetical protein